MSYTPGTTTLSQQIASLKQASLDGTAAIGITGATTGAFGKIYRVTGASSFAFTLPAAPTTGEGFIAIKLDAAYTGTVTVTPTSGTIDGAATFAMTGGGQENGFAIASGATNWDVM